MIKLMAVLLAFVLLGCTGIPSAASHETKEKAVSSIYEFTVKDINGSDVKLDTYRGKVLLVVNVASRCGYTPQYTGLEKTYTKYHDQGFETLGFPTNNFGGQEPGTNAEIKEFCTLKYNVTFPMFTKISVKGDDLNPLYAYLTDKTTDPEFGGPITWNFNKFLIGRDGKIIARFDSPDEPDSEKVTKAIEAALAAKPGK
ncbi:MAG: glutathione peroxidase [Pyrinomonadaceae bacterium]